MERLTHIDHEGWYVEDQSVAFDERRRGKDVDRLAFYEDTGLEPKDITRSLKTLDLFAEATKNIPLNRIRELAQAEKDGRLVVHGRWISWEEAGNFIPSSDRYECSVCHDAAQRLCNGVDLLSPYCPNCGAKMDLPEDGAENEGGSRQ